MIFEIAVGTGVKTVTVVRKGGVLHVDVDGRTHIVDAQRVGPSALSMLVRAGADGTPVRSIDVALATKPTPGEFDVHIGGQMISVTARPSTRLTANGPSGSLGIGPQKTAGPQRLTSPMPGKIVKVLVSVGDEVKARQGLIVVEAMKMENELRAARDGRVREIAAVEGRSVEAGAVLLVLE